jgi:predicted nuclease with TOPRIM domain
MQLVPLRLAYNMFKEKGPDWKITMKYFQNVVDTVRDLTSKAAAEQQYKNGMRKDDDGFMDINWCGKVPVDSWEHLCQLFQESNGRKAISPTQFNHQSTRGHCIMTLEVEKPSDDNPDLKQRGRLYVCDLAGTEPAGDIFYAEYKKVPQPDGSIEYQLQGPHQNQSKTKELQDQGKKINLSLTEMAQFFMKMAEAYKKGKLKPGATIPGCNSYFLCKYLKDTMVNAKTYLFCAIRPETKFHPYTYATLGFANNASVIKLQPKKATSAASPMERKLMAELDEMRALVDQLKKQLAEALANGGGGGGGAAADPVAAAAAMQTLVDMESQMTAKLQAAHNESNPVAAAAEQAYEKQKEHLKMRGITLASECDPATLNTPYLMNLDEDPFRSGRQLCILEKSPTSFGRQDDDVRPQSMSMVQNHCYIDGFGKTYKGGKGHTFVNGKMVKEGASLPIAPGDRILIGSELYIFHVPGEALAKETDVDAAFEEYRTAMMANSEYKDQFKKATKGLTSGGKNVKLDKSDAAQLENEMIELYPKAAELEQLCLLMDRDYIDTSVVLQSSKVTAAGKDDAQVKVKVVNRDANPVETIYLASFEFNRAYNILNDELYHLRDAIEADDQYKVPAQHDPLTLLFDATFHVGTAVMFPEYLIYNLETDESEVQLEVFPAAASGNQELNAGKLEVVWEPLAKPGDEPGGDVPEITDEAELLGKPWTYKCTIKQALQLPMICDLVYCEYEFFGGELFATESIDYGERPTRSPVLNYEFEHHVDCVTQEFLDWLKEPMEIKIYISLDVKKPDALAATDNQKVVDLIRADMKLPTKKIKYETADLQAKMEEMKKKMEALMTENASVKKENKRLVMQRRVAVAVARDVGQRLYAETGAAAEAAEAGGKKAPKTGKGEQGKGSSACVVM